MATSVRKYTEDGLPIISNQNVSANTETTEDGLPILKKKASTEPTIPTIPLDGSKPLQNGGVTSPTSTSTSKSTLGRDDKPVSPLTKTVVEGNNAEMAKQAQEQQIKNKNLFSGILSGKKPTTSLVSPENLEANIHDANKRQDITERFYKGDLKEEDLEAYGVKPNMGIDLPQLTNAINQKNKNLATISNLTQTQSIMPALQEWGNVKKDMERLNNQRQNLASRFVTPSQQDYEKIDAQLNNLKDKENFIKHGIDVVYNHKYTTEYQPQLLQLPALQKYIEKAALDYEGKLKSLNPEQRKGSPLGQAHIFDESDQYAIRKIVHDYMSSKNDVIAAAKEHGAGLALGENLKNTEYTDVENRIIDHIETAIPVQHATRKYNEQVAKNNPALKSFIDNGHNIKDTFSPEKYAQANSLAETHFNNDVLAANDNFNKALDANESGKSIMQKWASQVESKMVTPEIAQKNIIRDLQNNKETSALVKKREADIKNAKDKANDVRKGFLIGALQSANKDVSVYPDGSIGIKGMTKAQSQKALEDYYKGLGEVENKTLEAVSKARGRKADEVLADKGTYMASVDQAYKNMMYGLSAFMYAKTGHGGDAARVYNSSLSANNIDLSNVAKEHFEYKGINSLKSWDYWQHFLGSSTPLIAGATVLGAATGGIGEGAVALGAPEVVGTGLATVGNAGYMTAANLANSYGSLLKQGVNTYDASTATSNIAANDLLFNAFTGYLQSASLFGKTLKPTLLKTATNLTKNIAANTAMMTNQGLLQESAQAEALGNEKPNIVDYVKKHGVDSFVSALSFLPMDLYHGVQGHLASMKNWNELLNTTNAEIHQNKFYNNNIQHAINDNSASLIDNLMLMKENGDYKTDNEAETKANKISLENTILHAQGLERNIANAKLDRYNINDLYTAHNLTLADMHDALSKQLAGDNGENKALADFHKSKSKEYQEEASKSMNNEASFHYLVDGNDNPVILSDKALKVMTENGDIKKGMDKGYIKEVVKSDDAEFPSKYRKQLFEAEQLKKEVKKAEGEQAPIEKGTDKFVSKENEFEGRPIFSDYHSTIAKNGELLPFGKEVKQRLENGEKVTIVTKSGKDNPEENKAEILKTMGLSPEAEKNLTIIQGLSGEEKASLAEKSGGVLIDNSNAVAGEVENLGLGADIKFINANELNKREVAAEKATEPQQQEEKPTTPIPTSEVSVPKEEASVPSEENIQVAEPKEYISKSGRNKLVYDENGFAKVVDINTGKEVSKKTSKKVINEAADNYNFNVGEVSKEPKGISFKDEKEADQYVIDNSNNPLEIAETYIRQQPEGEVIDTKERQIAEYGLGKISQDSFKSFGDRNNIDSDIINSYFKGKKGEEARSIDEVAKEMSDHYGTEITPQDIVDFIIKFPKGESSALKESENSVAQSAKDKFEKLTGLPLNNEIATKAIENEFRKLTEGQQKLAEQQFDTIEQLEKEYWEQYAATNGFTEKSGNINVEPKEETVGEQTPTQDNANIGREAKIEQVERQRDKEADAEGREEDVFEDRGLVPPPPIVPPITEPIIKESGQPKFTQINKATQLKEVSALKEAYEAQGVKKWSESLEKGLNRVKQDYPHLSLKEGAEQMLYKHLSDIENGRIRMDDEDLAVMLYLKRETEQDLVKKSEDRFTAETPLSKEKANDSYKKLISQFEDIVKVIKAGGTTLGRSLVFLQAALGYDSDTGLEIKRGELRAAKGEPLSPEELERTARDWEEERASLIKSQEIEIEKIKKDFEKRLSDDVAKAKSESEKADKAQGGKVNKTKVEKPIRDKAKLILEDFATEFDERAKSEKIDTGSKETPQKMSSADAIREIKTGLDKGDKSIPDIIEKAVNKVDDGTDKEKLKLEIKTKLKEAGIDEEILNEPSSIEKSLNAIKEYAELNGVNDINNEMVGKKLIDDYIKAHFPSYDAKEILPQALEELKKVLPNVDENKLRKAYLKKDEFTQETSRKIKSKQQNTQIEFNAITKLENDINDLKELKDIKGKQFESQRERDEYEKGLIAEKEAILKDRREKAAAARKELRDKENEAKRQERAIKELTDKRDKLQQGIREKRAKSNEKIDTPEIEALKESVKVADKELRDKENELKKIQRDINRKNEQIEDYDKQIKRVNESGEYFKKNRNKSPKQIDKDLVKKQKELADSLRKKELKVSHTDSTTRASYETRASSHNQRVDDAIKDFKNKIEEIGDTTDKNFNRQKSMLENAIDELEKSKVYLDGTSEEPKFKAAEKAMKNALDVFKDAKDYENRLKAKSILDNYEEDKKKDELTIKLEKTKRKFQSDINEYERKINAGEFDDEPKKTEPFTQYDADLIRLENQRRLKKQAFELSKEKAASQNKGKNWQWRAAGVLARGLNVAFLIHSWKTLLKVAFSAGIKPQLNALTKLTTGKIFDALPFETTKAISKNAKLGGESNSIETLKKLQQAVWMQYGEKGLANLYEKSREKFKLAEGKYLDAKKELDEIPLSKSKEYDSKKTEVDKLKVDYGKAMVEDLGNMVYEFIAGRSFEDAYETFLHRVNKIEKEFGELNEERSDWQNQLVSVQSIEHLVGVMGRLHGALKTFSARSEFAAGFIARLEGNIEAGMPIDSNKILEIAYDSYPDWERGKYSEDNAVTRFWNDTLTNIEKKYPTVAAALRLDVAITRVPNNMLKELVMEYTAGSVIAVYKMNKAYRQAKGEAFDLGYTDRDSEEFKTALRERLNEIPAKEAATIARAFRKGGFGLGMFALASIGSMYFGASFGGFPHLGQSAEDKEKERRQKKTKEPETKTGDIRIGNYTLPKWVSMVIEHTPAFYPAMMALDAADVYKDKIKRGEISAAAAKDAVVSNVEHLIESSPQLERGQKWVFDPLSQRLLPPYKINDVDEKGNDIKRVTFTPEDYVKWVGIGNKKELLSEFWYKKATNAVKSAKHRKGEVETNKSLSEEQKEEKKKHIDEQLDKDIKSFYKNNEKHPSGKGFEPSTEQ